MGGGGQDIPLTQNSIPCIYHGLLYFSITGVNHAKYGTQVHEG